MLCKLACEVWDLNRQFSFHIISFGGRNCFRCDIFPLFPLRGDSRFDVEVYDGTQNVLSECRQANKQTISKAICIFRGVAKIWFSTPRGLAEKSQHSTCCTLAANRNKLTESRHKFSATTSERSGVVRRWKKWRRHQWALLNAILRAEALKLNEKQLFLGLAQIESWWVEITRLFANRIARIVVGGSDRVVVASDGSINNNN